MQNRNKLIALIIGNVSNAIVHNILGISIDDELIRGHYTKELKVSLDKAKSYRDKINPIGVPLPERDIEYIRDKITKKVKAELQLRISKGYENIDLSLIESRVDSTLKEMKII